MKNNYFLSQPTKPQSRFSILLILFWFCNIHTLHAQKLVINEVSQGSSHYNEEYVELLVLGEDPANNPGCQPCLDIRGWVIDDNNGDFNVAAGSQHISTGALRFAINDNWACVPNGALIVIYNEDSRNPSIIAVDDPTDSNQDHVYIVPGNSWLLEGDKDNPSPSNPDYLYATWFDSPAWDVANADQMISLSILNNMGDVFQVRDYNFNLVHSITWGTITGGDITFDGTNADGLVFEMENLVDDDPFNQANWIGSSVPAGETPGQPNNPTNAAWIASMIGSCVCVEELELTPLDTGSKTYFASEAIYSNDTIISGEDVIYDAGEITELQNGFSVGAGANLSILTEGCEID